MLNAIEFEGLVGPVINRAHANLVYKTKGFSDRAASFVLDRLGVTLSNKFNSPSSHLSKCAWIDSQVRQFFIHHPRGEGMEINSGLSTRFHRISEQLDWPQFSWNVVNPMDVNDCLRFVFPALDNHHFIGTHAPLLQWQEYVCWDEPRPRIVIIGEVSPIKNWAEFLEQLATIQNALTDKNPCIDLIICHSIVNFSDLCANNTLPIKLLATQTKFVARHYNLLQLCKKLWHTDVPAPEHLHHFRINRQPIKKD